MVKIHKEGNKIIFNTFTIFTLLNGVLYFLSVNEIILSLSILVCAVLAGLTVYFFRNPERPLVKDSQLVFCPADGKVVVIEEIHESEYFNDRRIQVSVFMSPLNVHVNRIPLSGKVKYFKYHKGLYLVAWHPKSSTDNERTTIVIEAENGQEIMLRQIAGAVARRIVCNHREGEIVEQGEELGVIKFGSRVDIILPLDTPIKVQLDQIVKANIDIIARFK